MEDRTTGHQLAMSLRAAYWAMHRRADALFGRLGVTADQFVLLSSLAEGDGITQQELVRRTASDPNTVRAMLVRLERRGLVVRRPHRDDGRAHSVTLTPSGRRIHRRLAARSEPLRARLLGGLEEDEVPDLVDMLARVAQAMTTRETTKERSKR
jgi:MarR family transcriptional regulator, lower aerobic nicotinate degradation pathway regulator